nr:hypothetical protein [Gammaproteobacteria bacterium]NIX57255.1 hypothetical protein [candidate division Zixibacteria bacterium]
REILEEALAYPGAIEALRRWENEFDMVIATTQPPAGRAPTFTWIARHDLPVDEVHITAHKYRIPGIALLDDFEDNLNHFQATGRLAVCLDQPWNLQWEGPRVGSPDEFFAYVWDYIHNRDSDFDEDMLLA